MTNKILFLVLLILAYGCQQKEISGPDYYRHLTEIHNELAYQVHLSINETKQLIIRHLNTGNAITKEEFEHLKMSYDSISALCNENLEELTEIGPFGTDSILYSSFIASLKLIEKINSEEFTTMLEYMEKGEMNAERINAIYTASVKLASNHINRIDSILKFSSRYDLELDTLELNLSKRKAKKFTSNISIMHNSVPIWGDCRNGYGQLKDIDGSIYTGHFRNGLFNGKGKLIYPNGESYEGAFINGSFQGYGIYRWENGKIYEGEWREDLFNGIGTIIRETGDTSTGYWIDGVLTEL